MKGQLNPRFIAACVVGALLLFVVGLCIGRYAFPASRTGFMAHPQGMYAVFLTNGQAYFGNIEQQNDQIVTLKHIFYLQKPEEGAPSTGDVTLLKLGNELHSPEDSMQISRSQILFVEQIKEDGKVGQAIKNYSQK